jgi:hypothetical protein
MGHIPARGLQTLEQAQTQARHEVAEAGEPRDIWIHVGDATLPGRGTYITRDPAWDAPRYTRWKKVETMQP